MKQCVKRRFELKILLKRHKLVHKERIFYSMMTMHIPDNETIIIILKPLFSKENSSFLVKPNRALRGQMTIAYKLTRWGGKKTKLQYALELYFNVGKNVVHKVPHTLVKSTVERQLNEVAEISIYFQRLMPLEVYGEEEGEALGYDLMWNTGSSSKRVKRIELVSKER